jgi:competence protein ComEA
MIAAIAAIALSAATAGAQERANAPKTTAAAQVPVNLNTATADQLATIPGIGTKTAERIIAYRQKNGGFKKIEELMNVKGVGEKSFLKLKTLITVAQKPGAPGGN